VAVSDKAKWGVRRRPNGEGAIARRMSGTRTENLATDYFAAKRSRKFTEVERLIVASVSQLRYDFSVHLKAHRHGPGWRHRLGLSVANFVSRGHDALRASLCGSVSSPTGALDQDRKARGCTRSRCSIVGVAARPFAPSPEPAAPGSPRITSQRSWRECRSAA
jgi:hypothetical protein